MYSNAYDDVAHFGVDSPVTKNLKYFEIKIFFALNKKMTH